MSKQSEKENLAKFVGLWAAHIILVEITDRPESVERMESEIGNYREMSAHLVHKNWNREDLDEIRELAIKRCEKKLEGYDDLDERRFDMIEEAVEGVMNEIGLEG